MAATGAAAAFLWLLTGAAGEDDLDEARDASVVFSAFARNGERSRIYLISFSEEVLMVGLSPAVPPLVAGLPPLGVVLPANLFVLWVAAAVLLAALLAIASRPLRSRGFSEELRKAGARLRVGRRPQERSKRCPTISSETVHNCWASPGSMA